VSVWSPSILMYEALLSSSSYLFVVCMCLCLRESGGRMGEGRERHRMMKRFVVSEREGFGGGLMNGCTYDERCPFAQQHLRSECCHFSLICEREVCSWKAQLCRCVHNECPLRRRLYIHSTLVKRTPSGCAHLRLE
jgi:hypothetical protein